MLNFWQKKEKTLEERMSGFSKKLSDNYGMQFAPKYPGMQTLKRIAEGKETYTTSEVIKILANEEKELLQREYLQSLKALRRDRIDSKHTPKELPKPIEEELKELGHKNIRVFQEVYETDVFEPINTAIKNLEKGGKNLSKSEAYGIIEKANTDIIDNPDFRVCLKSIARRM